MIRKSLGGKNDVEEFKAAKELLLVRREILFACLVRSR